MKTKLTIILLVLSLISITGCSKKTPEEIKKDEEASAAKELSDESWEIQSFVIEGKKLTLPFKAKELFDLGFKETERSSTVIGPCELRPIQLENDEYIIFVDIATDKKNEITLPESYVTSISLYRGANEGSKTKFLLPGGLSFASTEEEFYKVMGEDPNAFSFEYESAAETNVKYIYGDVSEKDKHGEVSIKFINGKIESYKTELILSTEDLIAGSFFKEEQK